MSRTASARMAEEIGRVAAAAETSSSSAASLPSSSRWAWPSVLRWIPTSTDRIIAAEKRLLSLVKTRYVQEQVNIVLGPLGQSKESSPTLVMVHGYGASQGFFFRNFDALASRFRVIAIDQLGWGGSSRPDFTCKSTEGMLSLARTIFETKMTFSSSALRLAWAETEAWFIDSFEEWRKAKNLSNFILLGHSFGGYVAAKYALKHPEHIQHLILVGPAGFSSETEHGSEWLTKFRATWKGIIVNHLWESNFTPQKIVRGLGPWGPDLVRRYTSARFGSYSTGDVLAEEESRLLTAFARKPLLQSASEWKVPTTFIYGYQDWMNYQGAQQARSEMKIPCEIIRVPQAGHFVFIDNPSGFHSAVFHACRRILSPDKADYQGLPEDLTAGKQVKQNANVVGDSEKGISEPHDENVSEGVEENKAHAEEVLKMDQKVIVHLMNRATLVNNAKKQVQKNITEDEAQKDVDGQAKQVKQNANVVGDSEKGISEPHDGNVSEGVEENKAHVEEDVEDGSESDSLFDEWSNFGDSNEDSVTHWTFANCKVRVFDLCSELFHTLWRVVNSVPTYVRISRIEVYNLAPKFEKSDFGQLSGSLQQAMYRYKVDGCTGTGPMVYRYTGSFSANPRLGFGNFVGCVPVRGPVYRYAVTEYDLGELQGCLCDCGLLYYHPRPFAGLLSWETQEDKVGSPSLLLF
uniref:AB hydrolase-1 domain-containing protein n=1 Tax=Ananas comosus var. bracteatus TaxID=296719 RepID=A0A6V7NTS5_ANACO|nr:unnamed protein product [Ananas comosus var. bracteatus]